MKTKRPTIHNLLMKNLWSKYSNFLLALGGGLLIGFSYVFSMFPFMWVGLVPLLFIIERNTWKQAIPFMFLMSLIATMIPFSWMYEVAQRYTGTDTKIGLILILVPSLIFFLTILIFSLSYSILLKGLAKKTLKIIGTGALWVLVECLSTWLLNGNPWQNINLAYTQVVDLYILQTASWGGIWSVSFILIIVNSFVFLAIKERKIKHVYFAVFTLAAVHIYGFITVGYIDSKSQSGKLKAAVITENIKPEERWADNTGQTTDEIFYQLNAEAIKGNPNLIIWSESAVPWAFQTNNSFIINSLQITYPSQAFHLMGLMMPNPEDTTMATNSAVVFAPDGAIKARYDKQELLKLLEKPFISSSWKLPFLTEGLMNNLYSTINTKPLNTPLGKIGTLICNESLRPFIARDMALEGARCFVIMSNDAWFEDTRMDFLHFYISRLRAIENRRTIIINSNRGYSGSILASGKISIREEKNEPNIFFENIALNSEKSFYTQRGDLLIFIFCLIVILLFFNKLKIKL